MAAYEELRAGFTAAVSHELRTPLARLLALLETATLPGADADELIEQAQGEVDKIRELIDDILFLSELESGHEVVGLGTTPALPILEEVAESLEEQAARAGVRLEVEADEDTELPLRPRMIRVVVVEPRRQRRPLRGPGRALTLSVARGGRRRARRRRRRRRRRGGRPPPPLRALLPRRPGTGLARHRARARDREARRDGGRRPVEATGGRGVGLTVRCLFPSSW